MQHSRTCAVVPGRSGKKLSLHPPPRQAASGPGDRCGISTICLGSPGPEPAPNRHRALATHFCRSVLALLLVACSDGSPAPPTATLTELPDGVDAAGADIVDAASPDAGLPDVAPSAEVAGGDDGSLVPDAPSLDAQAPDSTAPDDVREPCIPSASGVEVCNGKDDDCDGEMDEESCDDGDPCTLDVCDPTFGCYSDPSAILCCDDAAECYDGSSCTIDLCENGMCVYELDLPGYCCFEEADCDDGDACTDDPCVGGFCQHYVSSADGCCGITADCDDGDPCTMEVCQVHQCLYANQCCSSDEECKDDDETCTTDQCLDQTCVHVPTSAPGCCAESVYEGDFEDGTPEGHAIYNSVPGTGWQVVTTDKAHTGTSALYYGNPASLTYDTGDAPNHGSASGPVMVLPPGVKVTLTYWLFMQVETLLAVDQLTVRVLLVKNGVVAKTPIVWTKGKQPVYGGWMPVYVDLSAFSGEMIRLSFEFNTVDANFNDYEGIYLDDITVTTDCAPHTCTQASDCEDGLSITHDKCAGGYCVYDLDPGYCEWDYQCDDANQCTQDSCVDNLCVNADTNGCCQVDDDCNDELICTFDTCVQSWPINYCSHLWSADCCQSDPAGTAIGCDDLDPCTLDTCPTDGLPCLHTKIEGCCEKDLDCDDEEPCTADICKSGQCLHLDQCCTTDDDCDDGDDLCTVEACTLGECKYDFVDLAGCCKEALLDEGFDGTDGPFELTLSPETPPTGGVTWQTSAANAHSPPTSMWFGDAATGTYDAPGLAVKGTLRSAPFEVPLSAFTEVDLWVFLANEFALGAYPNPDWDRLIVAAQPLDALGEPDGAAGILWDSSWDAPVWWEKDPAGMPTGAKWTHLEHLDLTPLAPKQVRLLITFDSLDASNNDYPGAYVDDVRIRRTCGPQPK